MIFVLKIDETSYFFNHFRYNFDIGVILIENWTGDSNQIVNVFWLLWMKLNYFWLGGRTKTDLARPILFFFKFCRKRSPRI